MKVFIGSSREAIDLVREIEVWLEEEGHEPLPWDKPGLFPPGEHTFKVLTQLSREVGAAILVFAEDDNIWYRGDSVLQPRDNVLIEYGVFAGYLGAGKAIVCRSGEPKHPVDLAGLTYIDLSEPRRGRGRLELLIWARRLTSPDVDPTILSLQAKVYELERDKKKLRDRLGFEEDRARDLSDLLARAKVLDFSSYDLEGDGHWKLLFEYAYFQQVSTALARASSNPLELRQLLTDAGADAVAAKIAWHSPGDPERKALDMNPIRNQFLAGKALRRFRDSEEPRTFHEFIRRCPTKLRNDIDEIAREAIPRLSDRDDRERPL